MRDATDITIVLDRSGSMASVANDTIGGFNAFLAGQRAEPGEATVSLVQFDTEYEPLYTARPVAEAPDLTNKTFVPRGGTALLDAIGRTIIATGARLAGMADEDRPERVIFVILTDGEENSSREFHKAQIDEMIRHQTDAYQWAFVFLGANQNAIQTARSIGINSAAAMTYAATPKGTSEAFAASDRLVRNYRRAPVSQRAEYAAFTDEERKRQRDEGASSDKH